LENLDRRDLFAAISALAALGTLAGAATGAEPAKLATSKVFKYAELPVRKFPNGGEQRRVIAGTLTTGEFIEVHETMLPAGEMPHPSHKHPNSEMVFMQTGQCEFIDDDGKAIPAGPGDIIFTASNKLHGLKNVGGTPATYIVVSVSKQLPEG
jgi:XRE family transcriptional regulator, regulator of sulfur utilization